MTAYPAVTLTKRAAGIILVRLAQSGEPAASPLYGRVMAAWLHRTARTVAVIELDDAERALLREICPTELTVAGVEL